MTCSDCHSVTGERKRHKHIWMYSTFCEICDCDFDTWLHEEKDNLAHDIILEDMNRLITGMYTENKIDNATLLEIYHGMRDKARARGYLKLPWESEKQQQERNGLATEMQPTKRNDTRFL